MRLRRASGHPQAGSLLPLTLSAVLHRLQTLSGMSASDELDDSQVRQMLFDLESAYNAFNRFLHA